MNFDWIFSDFEAVIPAAARSSEPLRGKWQVAPYTIDGLAGNMIFANPDTAAPPITIPLPLQGTYEIVVAMREDLCDKVKIKLGSERSYDRIGYSFRSPVAGRELQEVPWRTVTLDGTETLVIKQALERRLGIAFIAARKAPGVTQPPPTYPKQYLVHFCDDGYPGIWGIPEDDEDAIWNVPPYKRMNVDMVSLGVEVSGLANYPSKHASLRVAVEKLSQRPPFYAHTLYQEVMSRSTYHILQENAARNRNIPQMFFARAHEVGMQALGYSRMGHPTEVAPTNGIQTRLSVEHPEWRCIDIDGLPVPRMSMAFPEVRAEFLKLFTETVEMGADGIHNVFKCAPLVLYEQPVLDAFRQEHGLDMRTLPEDEPRVQATRAGFVTAYMREQRRAIEKAGAGRKMTVAVTVHRMSAAAGFYGLDVAAWAREGLVDIVMPKSLPVHDPALAGDYEDLSFMDFYCAILKGTPVKLIPFVNDWATTEDPVALLRRALRFCAWPIDGLSLWDPYQTLAGWRGTDFDRAVRALCSAQAIRDCIADLEQHPPVRHKIRTQNGVNFQKYGIWNY